MTPQSGLLTGDGEDDILWSLRQVRHGISKYDAEDIAEYAQKICSPEVIAGELNAIYEDQLQYKKG